MTRLIEVPLASGGSVLWEVDEPAGGGKTLRGGGVATIERVGVTFEVVMGKLKPVVDAVVAGLEGLTKMPDTVEVELAVKLSADAGVVIAKAGSEASMRVKVGWKTARASAIG